VGVTEEDGVEGGQGRLVQPSRLTCPDDDRKAEAEGVWKRVDR
jgi:hypothetical protein